MTGAETSTPPVTYITVECGGLEGRATMVLRMAGEIQIDNLRHYPAETVEKLRALLAAGAEAHLDPRRASFYDVYNCSQVFFIHISPVSGKVLLLASWDQRRQPEATKVNSCPAS